MVADDSALMRKIITGHLQQMGILEVEYACDGAEALLKGKKEGWDVILLDWNMPLMQGIDVLRRIRRVSDVPIIMVTTENNRLNILLAIKEGATDYLMKPFTPKNFFEKINALRSQT